MPAAAGRPQSVVLSGAAGRSGRGGGGHHRPISVPLHRRWTGKTRSSSLVSIFLWVYCLLFFLPHIHCCCVIQRGALHEITQCSYYWFLPSFSFEVIPKYHWGSIVSPYQQSIANKSKCFVWISCTFLCCRVGARHLAVDAVNTRRPADCGRCTGFLIVVFFGFGVGFGCRWRRRTSGRCWSWRSSASTTSRAICARWTPAPSSRTSCCTRAASSSPSTGTPTFSLSSLPVWLPVSFFLSLGFFEPSHCRPVLLVPFLSYLLLYLLPYFLTYSLTFLFTPLLNPLLAPLLCYLLPYFLTNSLTLLLLTYSFTLLLLTNSLTFLLITSSLTWFLLTSSLTFLLLTYSFTFLLLTYSFTFLLLTYSFAFLLLTSSLVSLLSYSWILLLSYLLLSFLLTFLDASYLLS